MLYDKDTQAISTSIKIPLNVVEEVEIRIRWYWLLVNSFCEQFSWSLERQIFSFTSLSF